MEYINVNQKQFKIIKLLGHGKGGYSYLVEDEYENKYVVKQIHHEPCAYYSFGNKIESEVNAYKTLVECDIMLPELYDIDYENERILKEYIEGQTINEIIVLDQMKEDYYAQIKDIANKVYLRNLNIDYYPTNFILHNGKLYYIDYECNAFMEEWSYQNWGSKYWSKTVEFIKAFMNKEE